MQIIPLKQRESKPLRVELDTETRLVVSAARFHSGNLNGKNPIPYGFRTYPSGGTCTRKEHDKGQLHGYEIASRSVQRVPNCLNVQQKQAEEEFLHYVSLRTSLFDGSTASP